MSVLCQKRTFWAAVKNVVEYLVRLSEQRGRYGEPEGLSGFEIDDQLELGRRHYREIARLLAV